MPGTQPTSSPRILAYLQLMRLPNVFTAMADIFMGFWFTHETLEPIGVFVLLLISSSCLYTAGMVLNDVFDVEQDRRERPQRPIPSGRIPLATATRLGWGLMIAGFAAGCDAAMLARQTQPAIVAAFLAAAVLIYDRFAKRTAWGPVAMGVCRGINVILGMSASLGPLNVVHAYVAQALGVYIVGITWFAKYEAHKNRRNYLAGGLLIMLAGMILLCWYPVIFTHPRSAPGFYLQTNNWLALWMLLAGLISWRFIRAIVRPEPALVQAAVKSGILSIIVLDAAVVFAVRGCWAAIAVLLLLVPAIALGRWVYST